MAVSTVGTGKQFTTLQAWATAKRASTGVQDAECYGSVDPSASGVTFASWTPTSTRIYSAVSHGLLASNSAAFIRGAIDMTGFTGTNFIIDGLMLCTEGGELDMLGGGANGAVLTIQNCIFVASFEITPDTNGITMTINFVNNVALGACGFQSTGSGASGPTLNLNCYNNTFLTGMDFAEQGTSSIMNLVAKNNIAGTWSFATITRGTKTASNNLSADGTSTSILGGSGNILNTALASVLVDTATNFKLSAASVAIGAGTSIASVKTDAIGRSRRGITPSMGAHEYSSSGEPLDALARKLACLISD